MKCVTVTALIASALVFGITSSRAADLPLKAPPPPPPLSWAGFYVGGNLGAVNGNANYDPVCPVFNATNCPVLFPFYLKVLTFNLGLTFAVIAAIFVVLELSGQRVSVGDIFSTCLLQLFIQLSVVTLIFTLVERHLTKNPDKWDLSGTGGGLRFDLKIEKKIGVEIEPKGRISRMESVSIIIASTMALAWLTGIKTYPFLILGPAAAFFFWERCHREIRDSRVRFSNQVPRYSAHSRARRAGFDVRERPARESGNGVPGRAAARRDHVDEEHLHRA